MKQRNVIILAAGKCSRMNSQDPNKSKLMYEILSKPIISYAFFHANAIEPKRKVVVLGFGGDQIKKVVPSDWEIVVDSQIEGTGRSAIKAGDVLKDEEGSTLILYADMPLLRTKTLKALFKKHEENGNDLTFLTNYTRESLGRNRILREEKTDRILGVKEEKEQEQVEYCYEVDSGAYIFDNKAFFELAKELKADAKGEYSLISMVKIFANHNKKIGTLVNENEEECLSINNRMHLNTAFNIMKDRINARLMSLGVTILDSSSTYICPDATIGKDTVIHPNTYINGKSVIGSNNGIGPSVYIDNSTIGNDNTIVASTIKDSEVGNGANIGPFVEIANNSHIKDNEIIKRK